jgi:hypothetical protein
LYYPSPPATIGVRNTSVYEYVNFILCKESTEPGLRLFASRGARGSQTLLRNDGCKKFPVQLTTTPVVLYTFGRLSLVSLLTNFLILPAQPGVMMWGGTATLLGLVWLPLGQVVSWAAWLFLTYTVRMVEITARIPFAAVEVQRPSWIVMWLYYGLLLGWLAWKGGWLKSVGVVKPGDSS